MKIFVLLVLFLNVFVAVNNDSSYNDADKLFKQAAEVHHLVSLTFQAAATYLPGFPQITSNGNRGYKRVKVSRLKFYFSVFLSVFIWYFKIWNSRNYWPISTFEILFLFILNRALILIILSFFRNLNVL